MKQVNKDLVKLLKKEKFIVKLDENNWINIQKSKKNYLNVEFYPCVGERDNNFEVYTASYTLNNKEKEFNFELPYDIDYMIDTIKELLK